MADSRSEVKNQILREILLRLPGRVIVLLEEACDLGTIEFAAASSLPHIKRDRWAQDLWGNLEALLRRSEATHSIKEKARLALDTFLEPLPAGMRQSQPNIRHLLFETNLLSVDVSIERIPGSNSLLLAGQILPKSTLERTFKNVPVVLRGEKRLLGSSITNQSGEFLFEFEEEANVTLEIEDRPNHCVAIHCPRLNSSMGDEPQRADESSGISLLETIGAGSSRTWNVP